MRSVPLEEDDPSSGGEAWIAKKTSSLSLWKPFLVKEQLIITRRSVSNIANASKQSDGGPLKFFLTSLNKFQLPDDIDNPTITQRLFRVIIKVGHPFYQGISSDIKRLIVPIPLTLYKHNGHCQGYPPENLLTRDGGKRYFSQKKVVKDDWIIWRFFPSFFRTRKSQQKNTRAEKKEKKRKRENAGLILMEGCERAKIHKNKSF